MGVVEGVLVPGPHGVHRSIMAGVPLAHIEVVGPRLGIVPAALVPGRRGQEGQVLLVALGGVLMRVV